MKRGYLVRRVFCDQTITWDRFDLFGCPADPRTGMLLLGRDLAETIAIQHGRTLASISKPVILNEGGLFAGATQTEEQAWKNAARVLRAHVPMYLEVCKTLEQFQNWGEAIRIYNEKIRQRFRPAKMVWLMKALMLRPRDDQAWVLQTAAGAERIIANLSPAMLSVVPQKSKRLIDNNMLTYYLFSKIDAALPGSALDERYAAARKQYEELLNGAFSLRSGQMSIDGFLHSTKKSSNLQFVDGNGTVIKLEFGKLANNPQLLSRKYIDIMKMSVGDISALAIKAAANSDRITNGWKIISEFLHSLINGG